MRKTKLLMVAFLAMLGSSVYAAEYEVDQRFTSIEALDGQLFAIVNETDGNAIYNPQNQDLAYNTYANALTGAGYLWKIHSLATESDANAQSCYTLEVVKADGSSITIWGNRTPLLLNSGAEGGFNGCFVLDNGSQYGTDDRYCGIWEIEYTDGEGFALKNKGRGGYFSGPGAAPTGDTPIYWTFCTLKETEASIVARYKARYAEIKPLIEALDDDKTIFQGDATVDVSEADAALDAATTIAGVDAAIDKLYEAATTFVTSVTVNAGKYFDLSNIWMVNPSVRQNIDGWTIENLSATGGSAGVTNYNETEFYQRNFDFFQTLTLPKGTYEFGVTGFHRAGNHKTYFYAGADDKVLIPGVESSLVNSMAQAETYFDAGNGKVSLKFALENESNTIKIGIENNDTETDKWTIFRDFKLYYYGSECDYSVYEERWNGLVTDAGTAKTAHPIVTGKELADLEAALADAPNGSSKANYTEKIDALDAAIVTFNAAAPAYDAFKNEINATVATTLGVDIPTIFNTTTAAQLPLLVGEFYVNAFTVANAYDLDFTSKLGEWTNAPGTNKGESWDGSTGDTGDTYLDLYNKEYREMTQTVTLPAGDYALIAKGRASTNGLLAVTDGTETVTFPHKSSTGRGIATDGTATFADGATYANNNNGRGWEYRVLTFTSDGTTPITLAFQWTTASNNWAGLDDIVLKAKNITEAITISDAGYATYCSPYALDFTNVTGLTAYTATMNGTTVEFTKVEGSVPAGTGLLVKGETATVPVVASSNTDVTDNVLKGVLEKTGVDAGIFVLMPTQKGAAFKKTENAFTLRPNSAYLPADVSKARIIAINLDGEATGIETVKAAEASEAIFNLAGQRVVKAQKGLYIQNGKKHIVK